MSVFKKKADIFTPENKKIRIEKIPKWRTQKSCPRLSENKGKNGSLKPSPNTGKVSAELTEGASLSRNAKTVSYRTAINTCLSFLNGGRKQSGIE